MNEAIGEAMKNEDKPLGPNLFPLIVVCVCLLWAVALAWLLL